jgi:serine/threonine-protein kinase RsbW/sigma-B regulation protein RsbU (phosphoserine phosphatase)
MSLRGPGASTVASRARPLERVEMVIANRVEELARVAARLDDLAARRGLPHDAVVDMNVALDEVLKNVLSHAYDDAGAHEIRIALAVYAGALEAEVEDDGRPFDPLTVAPPDRSAPLAARKVGGLGIHLMRNLMSDVAYRRVGERNRLVLIKALAADPG